MNSLNHLAIIMDGNGRWAKGKGLIRSRGHEQGVKTLKDIIACTLECGIKELSAFAFSTENWKRPRSEIDFIFTLLRKNLATLKPEFLRNDIRFVAFGNLAKLDNDLQKEIKEFENATKNCSKLRFNLGINYGGIDEILRAFDRLKEQNLENNFDNFYQALDISSPVDLLIRTGGCKRLSNFLLVQCAYAELAFSDTLFPEFSRTELLKIIENYRQTTRNFGGI